MKKLLLLVLPLFVLAGCSMSVNTDTTQLTGTQQIDETANTGNEISTNTVKATITKDQGYLTQVYTTGNKNYLKIDYITYGTCLPDMSNCPGGGAPIINDNPLIRTFEIDSSATFSVIKNPQPSNSSQTLVSFSEFKTRGNSTRKELNPNMLNPIYYGAGKISIVEISHDTQKVYKVTEVYRP